MLFGACFLRNFQVWQPRHVVVCWLFPDGNDVGLHLFSVDDHVEDIDHDMGTEELIRHYGYGCQHHIVTTNDGFVLALHRIIVDDVCYSSSASLH